MSGDLLLEAYDVLGRPLMQQQVSIDVSARLAGIYFVRLVDSGAAIRRAALRAMVCGFFTR